MSPAPPATPAGEDALLPLSALQHHLFCPRQCALIHVEQLWAEDGATAEGRLLHERVDAGGGDSRPAVKVARGLMLRSLTLGVAGRADAVEFRGRPSAPYPVEYKRGKPKAHRADDVQLARRRSASRRCSRRPCRRVPCSTARRVGAPSSSSMASCAP